MMSTVLKRLGLLGLIGIVLLMSGCAVFRTHGDDSPRVEIFQGQWVRLPTPEELGLNIQATQLLSATYGKDTYTSQVELNIDKKRLILVALSGWGGEVFSIDYDGETIKSSHLPMPHADMGIQHTVTDFMLTYAPISVLKKMFQGTDLNIIVSAHKRFILLNQKLVVKIHYQYENPWKGKVTLENLAYHYSIVVRNLG